MQLPMLTDLLQLPGVATPVTAAGAQSTSQATDFKEYFSKFAEAGQGLSERELQLLLQQYSSDLPVTGALPLSPVPLLDSTALPLSGNTLPGLGSGLPFSGGHAGSLLPFESTISAAIQSMPQPAISQGVAVENTQNPVLGLGARSNLQQAEGVELSPMELSAQSAVRKPPSEELPLPPPVQSFNELEQKRDSAGRLADFQRPSEAVSPTLNLAKVSGPLQNEAASSAVPNPQPVSPAMHSMLNIIPADLTLAASVVVAERAPVAETALLNGGAASVGAAYPDSVNLESAKLPGIDIRRDDYDFQLARSMLWMIGKDQHQARLKLNPPELGTVSVQLELQHNEVKINLVTQTAAARDVLDAALPRLRELISEQGMNLVQADVSNQHSQAKSFRHWEPDSPALNEPACEDAESGQTDPRPMAASPQMLLDEYA